MPRSCKGRNVNWDLRNYHLYNPFALLNGRFPLDLMPAGLQTNFNPLLDLPYYVLAAGPLAAAPRLMAAAAGLPFGLLLFATLSLARWVLPAPDAAGRLLPWIAAAIGGTAAVTVAEIGTTFNDIPCAALLVGALAVGGPGCTARPVTWRLACAGAMAGAAVALKLTSAVIAPGVLVGLLVATPGWRGRGRVLVVFGATASLTALVLAGPWALLLHQRYASPTFPLMNHLFRSPWYPPEDIIDPNFLPRSTLQAWFYPFWWIGRNAGLVTEGPFRDARLALAMLALPVLAVGLLRAEPARRRRVSALLLAAAIGYLGWLRSFSILRYAVTLEAFAAVIIVVAVQDFCRLRWLRGSSVLLGGAGAGGGAAGGAALADAGGGLGAHSVRPPRVRHRGHHVAAGQSGAVGQRAGGGAAPVPGCAGLPGRRHHWADVRRPRLAPPRRGDADHPHARRPGLRDRPGQRCPATRAARGRAGVRRRAMPAGPRQYQPRRRDRPVPGAAPGTAAVLAGFRRGGRARYKSL